MTITASKSLPNSTANRYAQAVKKDNDTTMTMKLKNKLEAENLTVRLTA